MFLLLQPVHLFFFTKNVGLQVTSPETSEMSLFRSEKEPYLCGNGWLTDRECLSPGVDKPTAHSFYFYPDDADMTIPCFFFF